MGSEVAIFEMGSGRVRSVWKTERLVEAPNWTRDGSALIINGSGLLYRLDLANPEPVRIDTGIARAINNDHGISPDGSLLAISDETEHGASCIYILPLEGGEPRCVLPLTPSYWHGWSPDGERLAYVARRRGTFQVYTMPASGGQELRVTHDFNHCDGPDYSADGKFIWFNGERDTSVQLWRCKPDGSDAERMTDDERVNWFPHPSPDGKHVVYLAYEPGTTGHPRNKQVELRILPAGGGKAQTLLQLFGGQGTINVPSWNPNGSAFAFVRYET